MTAELLPMPTEWNQILNSFSSCFSKPQFNNFSLFATALAVSQHSTVSRLAGFAPDKDQSSLNRFLTESPWQEATVKDKLSRMTAKTFKDCYIAVLDDTLSAKPFAKKMSFLGMHRDGMDGQVKQGHNIVTFGFTGLEGTLVPFDYELYAPNSGRSKNDIGVCMLDRTSRFKKPFMAVFDAWYSNEKIIGKCKEKGIRFVTELKSNRNATLNSRKRYIREHEKHIQKKDWQEHLINNRKFRSFSCSAFISNIGNIRLVFSQMWLEDDEKWSETYYLATDLLGMPDFDVIRHYLLRSGIEGFHREAKQQLGLNKYQLRKGRGIERHLFLAMLVYVMLLMLLKHLLLKSRREVSLSSLSIGKLCQLLRRELYTALLRRAKHYNSDYIKRLASKLAYAM